MTKKMSKFEKWHINWDEKSFTDDIDMLKLKNDKGTRSIAHHQAQVGWTTEVPEILKLTTYLGTTVAQIQIRGGWTTEDPEILKYRVNTEMNLKAGYSLAEFQIMNGWIPKGDIKNLIIKGRTIKEMFKAYTKLKI
jgi:hypothetical protein